MFFVWIWLGIWFDCLGGSVFFDVWMYYICYIKVFLLICVFMFFYFWLLVIYDFIFIVGFVDFNIGCLVLFCFMCNSYSWMVVEGVYLMINGEIVMFWFG